MIIKCIVIKSNQSVLIHSQYLHACVCGGGDREGDRECIHTRARLVLSKNLWAFNRSLWPVIWCIAKKPLYVTEGYRERSMV